MTILESTPRTAEFLLSEGNGEISREVVDLAITSVALSAGQVLGIVTIGGAYAPYDPEATTGEQTAVAILYAAAPISSAVQRVTVIARNAEVSEAKLVGSDADALTDLAAKGIIARS